MTGEMIVIIINPARENLFINETNRLLWDISVSQKVTSLGQKIFQCCEPPVTIKLLTFPSSIPFMLLFNLGTSA